jgi:hypothetical protein
VISETIGTAPAKKKKLGKKERERMKAAKAREEAEQKAAEELAKAAKRASRLAGIPDHGKTDRQRKNKRKSKKRRMNEMQAAGTGVR